MIKFIRVVPENDKHVRAENGQKHQHGDITFPLDQ